VSRHWSGIYRNFDRLAILNRQEDTNIIRCQINHTERVNVVVVKEKRIQTREESFHATHDRIEERAVPLFYGRDVFVKNNIIRRIRRSSR
jgi:hypothetical protein